MARKVMNWGVPLGAFLAALGLGIFAAPTLGVISARAQLLTSSGPPPVCADLRLDQRGSVFNDMPGGGAMIEGDPATTSLVTDSPTGLNYHSGARRKGFAEASRSAGHHG